MIPGKQYRPEDFIRAAWRRRWMILAPVVLAAIATAIWSLRQPDEYRSETTLLIVPPSGGGNLVAGPEVVPIEDRLYTIRQQVVSHDRLVDLVNSADLYSDWRRAHPQADLAERMRRDVDIAIVKGNPRRIDGNFFKIAFVSTNPQTAAMVTNRLADLLVRENGDDRKNAARAAAVFIESQLDEARSKLEAQEAKVEAFRQRYASEQPSMLQSNLETIRRTETQLQNLELALSADRGQRLALESMIAAAQIPVPKGAAAEARRRPAEVSGASIGVQLDAARSDLKALELQLTSEHPDVIRAQRRIRELEERARAEGVPQSADGGLLSAAEVERRQRLQELLAELNLAPLAKAPAHTLSGGERRRVEITRALVVSPRFMLLDEPFAGIDPIAVTDIQKIIFHLKERGIGVLVTDHNVRETLRITDRAYIVHDGAIFRNGTPASLAADEEVRRIYLGADFRLD